MNNYPQRLFFLLITLTFLGCTQDKEKSTKDPFVEAIHSSIERTAGSKRKTPKEFIDLLNKYSQETNEIERFELCTKIGLAKLSFSLSNIGSSDENKKKYTSEESKIINNANQYCQWTASILENFERSLSQEQRTEITKTIKHSLLPYTHSIFSKADCTEAELNNLDKLNNDLLTNTNDSTIYGNIMRLTHLSESSHYEHYFNEYQKILNTLSHPNKKLLIHVFNRAVAQYKTAGSRPGLLGTEYQSQQRAIKSLKKMGVKNPMAFSYEIAKHAPNCLGRININALNLIQTKITKRNLKNFFEKLKTYTQTFNRFPDTSAHDSTSKALTIRDDRFSVYLKQINVSHKDGYQRPILVTRNGDKFTVFSTGKDRKIDTEDDISYPQQ